MIERLFSGMEILRSVTAFDENTGPVLANLLNRPEVCEILSVVRECPLCSFLGKNFWFGSQMGRPGHCTGAFPLETQN